MSSTEASFWFAAVVRNCGKTLDKHLRAVEQFRFRHPQTSIVLVENDSVDQTKSILETWRKRHPWIHVLTLDGKTGAYDRAMRSAGLPWFGEARISKMAFLRNSYLDYLDSQPTEPDYLVVVDLDLQDIDFEAISHLITEGGWDALMANSRAIGDGYQWWRARIYYDAYAFKRLGDNTPTTLAQIARTQRFVLGELKQGPIAVESAFGGVAIYRWKTIKGLRYGVEANQDENVKMICEHHSLHRKMINQRNARLFVHPKLKAEYHGFARAMLVSLYVCASRLCGKFAGRETSCL